MFVLKLSGIQKKLPFVLFFEPHCQVKISKTQAEQYLFPALYKYLISLINHFPVFGFIKKGYYGVYTEFHISCYQLLIWEFKLVILCKFGGKL